MNWEQTKDLILMGIPTLGVGIISYYLNKMDKTGEELSKSIQELNIKVAVILEKINGHEDRIKKLEDDQT